MKKRYLMDWLCLGLAAGTMLWFGSFQGKCPFAGDDATPTACSRQQITDRDPMQPLPQGQRAVGCGSRPMRPAQSAPVSRPVNPDPFARHL